MEWILIGVVVGSFVVSGHNTEEGCLGRKAVLDKQKIAATRKLAEWRAKKAEGKTAGGKTTAAVPAKAAKAAKK